MCFVKINNQIFVQPLLEFVEAAGHRTVSKSKNRSLFHVQTNDVIYKNKVISHKKKTSLKNCITPVTNIM